MKIKQFYLDRKSINNYWVHKDHLRSYALLDLFVPMNFFDNLKRFDINLE